MPEKDGKERRVHTRREYKGAQVLCYDASAPKTSNPYNHAIKIVNVSQGGICILSFMKLDAGKEMIVDISFQQHGANLKSTAIVKWSFAVEVNEKMINMAGLEFVGEPEMHGKVMEALTGKRHSVIDEHKAREEKQVNRRIAKRLKVHAEKIVVTPPGFLSGIGMVKNTGHALVDISRTGCQLQTTKEMKKGDEMKIRLHIPRAGGDTLAVDARVMWCRPDPRGYKGFFVAGFRFLDLSNKAEKILDKLEL